jgi:hypothetical protein
MVARVGLAGERAQREAVAELVDHQAPVAEFEAHRGGVIVLGVLLCGPFDQPRREECEGDRDQDLRAPDAHGVGDQSPDHDGNRRDHGKGADRIEETPTPQGDEAHCGAYGNGHYDDRDRPLHRADLPHSGRLWLR